MVNSPKFLINVISAIACSLSLTLTLDGLTRPSYSQTPDTETANTRVIPPSLAFDMHPVHRINGYRFSVKSLAFSPNGEVLVSGGSNNEPFLRFWSVARGKKLGAVRAQRSGVLALAVTPDARFVLTSGEDDDIHFWDPYTRENQGVFLDHNGNILGLVVTPDSRIAVSGGLDGIRVWNIQPSRLLYTLVGFGTPSYALAVHPNGYVIASGDNNGEVSLWNIREGTLISQFNPHQGTITGLVITQDGRQLITASADRTVKVWDLATGELLHTFEGHNNAIRAIALSPNNQFLATSSNDGIRVWDFPNRRLFRYVMDQDDWVESLAFSPDSRFLASGGNDGVIVIWRMRTLSNQPTPFQPSETLIEESDVQDNILEEEDIIQENILEEEDIIQEN
ncbi:MAG: WD40 repeat domain-containing protein [Microcystaceae cyanobacterium]